MGQTTVSLVERRTAPTDFARGNPETVVCP
jgi:hypothetical protein